MYKKYLRSLQSHLPALRPSKFAFKNFGTRNFGLFIDRDFALLRDVTPVDLIVDIGGNWGQSIYAFKSLTRPRQIISFEPSPYLSKYLADAFRDDPSVKIEPFALGKSVGQFDLYTPMYNDYVWDGLASTIYEDAKNWLSPDTLAGFNPNKLSILTDAVEVRTLDSFGLKPDIVKIDVQGAELAVVEGGIETFDKFKPITLIEDPKPELIALMNTLGLYPFKLAGRSLIRNDVTSINTAFISNEWIDAFSKKGYTIK